MFVHVWKSEKKASTARLLMCVTKFFVLLDLFKVCSVSKIHPAHDSFWNFEETEISWKAGLTGKSEILLVHHAAIRKARLASVVPIQTSMGNQIFQISHFKTDRHWAILATDRTEKLIALGAFDFANLLHHWENRTFYSFCTRQK